MLSNNYKTLLYCLFSLTEISSFHSQNINDTSCGSANSLLSTLPNMPKLHKAVSFLDSPGLYCYANLRLLDRLHFHNANKLIRTITHLNEAHPLCFLQTCFDSFFLTKIFFFCKKNFLFFPKEKEKEMAGSIKDEEKMSIKLPSNNVTSSRSIFNFWRKERGATMMVKTKTPRSDSNIRPSVTRQLGRWVCDRAKLQQMGEVDILKKMRDHIMFRLDQMTSSNPKLQVCFFFFVCIEIHAALDEVWYGEYAILKHRLKKTSIKAKSEKMRAETTRALESLVVTKNETQAEYQDSDDFDVRETALWIMNNFLPKATVDNIVTTSNLNDEDEGNEGQRTKQGTNAKG
ncbi:hypothetical protein RFI_18961, partial [Reticulomyxa filosa]